MCVNRVIAMHMDLKDIAMHMDLKDIACICASTEVSRCTMFKALPLQGLPVGMTQEMFDDYRRCRRNNEFAQE